MDITLAIDAMGGDHGPHVTVPAALKALAEDDQLNIVLVGLEDAIQAELKAQNATTHSRLRIHHASQVVLMDESPQSAMKNKKDSSMRVAINLTKSGEANACVSAGNTGALMATARFVLKTLPGIERPAIASALPSERGSTYMLDLGANADCTAEQLLQFAVMGLAHMMGKFLTQEFKKNWLSKLMALFAMPVLKAFKKRLDPRRYNGASFLGLRGIVVKSHGGVDSFGFYHAIHVAKEEARNGVLKRITEQLEIEHIQSVKEAAVDVEGKRNE